jgi:hypothetical protein
MQFATSIVNHGLLTWIGRDWSERFQGQFRREGVYIHDADHELVKFHVWIHIRLDGTGSTWELQVYDPGYDCFDSVATSCLQTSEFYEIVLDVVTFMNNMKSDLFIG